MRSVAVSLVLALSLTSVLAGCVAPGGLLDKGGSGAAALAFSAPVSLTADGHGYEPSVKVGPDGTVYVTAHKASVTNEGTRLASWLWYSRDNGTTWNEMPTPLQAHDKLFAFEGDLAVDAAGRVYYVDTYLADNTLSVWDTGADGPEWLSTRPVHGTTGVDDRPWLAAHGDGVVYYLGNNGAAIAPTNDPSGTARIWFYRSEDAGTTWSTGHGFVNSGWCGLAASPADDQTVFVGCNRGFDKGAEAVVYRSADRGVTWEETVVAQMDAGSGPNFPSMGTDRDGRPLFAWLDESLADDDAGRVKLASSADGAAWTEEDITPFVGSFGMVWVSGGDGGKVAVTFYGTPDVEPTAESEWHPYLLLRERAGDAFTLVRLAEEPSARASYPPGDFFQNVIGPANEVHVAFQRHVPEAQSPQAGYTNAILHTAQTGGAGVRGGA